MIAPDTPTLSDLAAGIADNIKTRMGITRSLLAKSFIYALSYSLAGAVIILYKFGSYILAQQFVSTASAKEVTFLGRTVTPIIEWGRLVGIGDPTAAVAAQLSVTATVTTQGGTLQAGEKMQGESNGVTYMIMSSVDLASSLVTFTVEAVDDQQGGDGSGTIGNLDADEVINFQTPLTGLQRSAVVAGTVTAGTDAEDVDTDYRQRVVDRFQLQPEGGALTDHKLWAESADGVKSAYPYVGETPGTVLVYIEAESTTDGLATESILTAAQEALIYDDSGLASRAPISAYPEVASITRPEWTVTLTGLDAGEGDLDDLKSDIEDAVDEYFADREPYIQGLSLNPRTDKINRDAIAGVIFGITENAGGTFDSVTLTDSDDTETTSYTLGAGEKAKAGVEYATS